MKKYRGIAIALTILLSGMALVPYVALPAEQFAWQRFADAYQPADKLIVIEDFAYSAELVILPAGATVRWVNLDTVEHTVTSDIPGLFDSGTLAPGDVFDHPFNTLGTFAYHCSLHPSMTGAVIVTSNVFSLYLPLASQNAAR
jgi:plastocyanin